VVIALIPFNSLCEIPNNVFVPEGLPKTKAFNSLCEIPIPEAKHYVPAKTPFNSLCEIREAYFWNTYVVWKPTFNSLCEIPSLTFLVVSARSPFNSLCEIPWEGEEEGGCPFRFQFSL